MKLLISPLNLNKILARQSIRGCRFFFFFFPLSVLFIYCATLFPSAGFLWKNQLTALWEFPCVLFAAFPFLPLIIFYLYKFNFCHFDYNVSWCVRSWVNPVWDSVLGPWTVTLSSWIWVTVSFPRLGKFSAIMFSHIFRPFFLFLLGSLWCDC